MRTVALSHRDIIKALMPTISERPECWYKLVERLVSEGFVYHADHVGEWRKGNGTTEPVVRGRICFTPTKAWLRHPYTNEQTHHTEAAQ